MSEEEEEEEPQQDDNRPQYLVGRWSDEENQLFMTGYRLFGKNWRKIARVVKTRSNIQCRTHAQRMLDTLLLESSFSIDSSGNALLQLAQSPAASNVARHNGHQQQFQLRDAMARIVVQNFRDQLAREWGAMRATPL